MPLVTVKDVLSKKTGTEKEKKSGLVTVNDVMKSQPQKPKPAGTTQKGFRQLEQKSVNPTVGENLFSTNALPIKQNDNIAVKAGKGIVNAAISTVNSPFELARHIAIGGSKALTGGNFLDVPKETSYVNDIIAPALPKKAVEKYTNFTQKNPLIGAASQALIDATDPAMYVGVGGIDKLNPLMKGTTRQAGEMLNLRNSPKLTSKPVQKVSDVADVIPEQRTTAKSTPVFVPMSLKVANGTDIPMSLMEQNMRASDQLLPNPLKSIEMAKLTRQPKLKSEGVNPKSYTIYRRGAEGENLSSETKPHGLYTSLVENKNTFESPHKDVGDTDYWGVATANKPLIANETKAKHARFDGNIGELSSGVAALKSLVSPPEFERLMQADKGKLIQELNSKFPGPDYNKYYDAYELLEAYAANLAREKGYDSIILRDTVFPEFSEFVSLKNDIVKWENQSANFKNKQALELKMPETQAADNLGSTLRTKLTPEIDRQKPRQLGVSASEAPWVSRELAQELKGEIKPGGRGAYDPISNEQTLAEARQAITQDREAIVRRIMSDKPADRVDNTAGLLLVKEANDSGDIALAVDLTEALAKKATDAGQAIQALSMWGRLTPEGMLSYAQKVVKNTNDDLARAGNKKRIKLSEADAKKIIDIMKQADGLEGRAKDIKAAQALDLVASQIPPSWGRRIATIQTMAQLLNPKTATRNIVGNVGFAGMENISDVVGTGLDKATGLITGNRTKVLPSAGTQLKGAKQGFKLGLEDAILGIDTSAMKGGKFDIPQNKTFRSGPLSYAEKAMNIELRATDRAFYQAAFDESLRQQTAAAKMSKKSPTTEQIQEIAHFDALYRTFQDNSAAAQAFSGIKKAFNKVGTKDFGLGDVVLKYPKTPGNLLSRGIEYSPAGFIKAIMEIGKPLIGREFNQKAFVESLSRALVGSTMLVGTGAIMHRLGLLTGSPDQDYDIENLKAQAGFGQYKVNASGVKRFIVSGFDPNEAKLRKGDMLVSYDWFQPDSIGLAMGADIDKNKGQKKGVVGKLGAALTYGLGGVAAGANALAEQPLLQGVQTLFGSNGDMAAGLLTIAEGVPASFMPTLLNQIKQLIDNQKRLSYSPDYATEMGNKVKTKIPGAASDLPKAYGTLGQPLPAYQQGESSLTGNNPFNVLFNPAFVSQYKPLPAAQRVLDVYGETGNSEVFPRTVKKYIEFTPKGSDQSQRIDLTAKEYSDYQRLVGEYANENINQLSPSLRAEKQVKKLKGILDDANERAKKEILSGRGLRAKRD